MAGKPTPTTILILAGGAFAILVIILLFSPRTPPPAEVVEADDSPRVETRDLTPPRLSASRSGDRSAAPGVSPEPGVIPHPTPLPPADPMAEVRVDPFAGRVIDGMSFEGIEGARISALLFDAGRYQVAPHYPTKIDEISSGADGRFKFQEQQPAREEALGWLAEHDGYHRELLIFPAGEGLGDRLRSTFQLKPAGIIAGQVIDQDDEPIAGALVGDILLGTPARPGQAGENRFPSAFDYTRNDGAFTLDALEKDTEVRIPVRADGYVSTMSEPIPVGTTDVVFRLIRADTSLTGIVRDWEGRPARGARLELQVIDTRIGQIDMPRRMTATNREGRFAFAGLVAGEYTLETTLEVPETLGLGCKDFRHVVMQTGVEKEVEIDLPAPSMLSGRFVDSTTGDGVAGVRLYSNIDDVTVREQAFQVESDRDGSFSFTAFVPDYPEGYEVRIPVNWGEEWFPLPREEQDELVRTEQEYLSLLAVRPGEDREEIEILLGPGSVLTGVVLQPDGTTPAAETPIYIRGERHFDNMVTDLLGEFRFSVPNNVRLRLESSTEEGIGATSVMTRPQNPKVTLQLQEYGILEGLLIEEDGTPVHDRVVSVVRSGHDGAFEDAIQFEEKGLSMEDGTWRIDNVAPGSLSLMPELSQSDGYAPPRPRDVHLDPGEHLDGIEIVLEAGDYIDGLVVDANTGDPIEGVTLFTNLREVSGLSDETGRFRLQGVPYDTALSQVTASKEGYGEETRRNISIYDGDVVFRLQPQSEVNLRVTTEGGSPIASYRARLLTSRPDLAGPGSQAIREVVGNDPDGRISLGNLANGSYRVEVIELPAGGGSGRPGGTDFVISPRDTGPRTIEVRLDAGTMIDGVVMRGTAVVPEARVELLNPPLSLRPATVRPDSPPYSVAVDGGGSFSLGPLPPGSYQLRATAMGASSSVKTVVLGTDREYVELEMQATPRLYGTITARNGEPVRRAGIFLIGPSGRPEGPPIQVRGGNYEIDLPSEGTWQLAFNDEDSPDTITRKVTMAAGESRELSITFANRVTLSGRIVVNGGVGTAPTPILLRSDEGEDALAIPQGSGGQYEVDLSPGRYQLYYDSGQVTAPFEDTIIVHTDPPRQSQDLIVNLAALDILTIPPDDQPIDGHLTLETVRDGRPIVILSHFPIDRPSMRFLQLPAGAYRGEFYVNGEVIAESDWVEVLPNQPGILTIALP